MDRSAIVVGVAPTVEGHAALDWAADEAALRGCPLHLVHATGDELAAWIQLVPDDLAAVVRGISDDAARLLAAAAERARRRAPSVPVTVAVIGEGRARALRDSAVGAEALVVGNHERGAHATPGLDVLAPFLTDGFPCPVVAVPRSRPGGGLTVLADGSPASGETLHYGFRQSALRGLRLRVLLCLPVATVDEAQGGPTLVGFERRVVHDRVTQMRRAFPDVPVEMVEEEAVDLALEGLATCGEVVVAGAAHARRVLELVHGTPSAELAAAVVVLPASELPAGDPSCPSCPHCPRSRRRRPTGQDRGRSPSWSRCPYRSGGATDVATGGT